MKSKRLIYKVLEEEDFSLYYQLYSNPTVMKFAYHDEAKSEEDARVRFERELSSQKQNNCVECLVFLKEGHEFIGIVDYDVQVKNDYGAVFELGYFILPEYWGKGYATEMSHMMIDHIFSESKAHKIIAQCNAGNNHSEKIMLKLGMKIEGIARKARYKHGQWEDELWYSILFEEWQNHVDLRKKNYQAKEVDVLK